MRLFANWQQLHQRPHGDPLDVVLSALVSQNSHPDRLRLYTLKGLNSGPNCFAHSKNGVYDQHLLTLNSGETWVYRPGNLLLPSRCGLTEATGFPSDLATMRPSAMPPASIPATTSGSSIRFCSTASRTISAIALPTSVNRRTLDPIGFQLT